MKCFGGIAPATGPPAGIINAALASSGLGNNIRAQNEARTAGTWSPAITIYQNLWTGCRTPDGSTYQQAYTQPGSRQHGT